MEWISCPAAQKTQKVIAIKKGPGQLPKIRPVASPSHWAESVWRGYRIAVIGEPFLALGR